MRSLLRQCFQNAGYEVDSVDEGGQALEVIEAHRPDLMILDWTGPGLDGRTLFDHVRSRKDAPPVIVLTANVTDADYRPAPDGAAAAVAKPFTFPMLLGVCEAVVLSNA